MKTSSALLVTALLATAGPSRAAAEDASPIRWFPGTFESAQRQARGAEGLLFVYFWMDGSDFCSKLYGETLTTPEAAKALEDFVCLSAKATEARGADLIERFDVTTLPTMLFLTPEGAAEDAILGYIPTQDFVGEVQRICAGQDTVSALRAQVAQAPDDLDLRFRLSVKLQDVGARTESTELLESIKLDDPQGLTVIGAQLRLYDVMNAVLAEAADRTDPATFDLEPVYDHMQDMKSEPVLFEGWDWIAGVEHQRGERVKARTAYRRAWAHIPEATVSDWGGELVGRYWDSRQELTSKDRSFALEVALAAVARAEKLLEEAAEDDRGEMVGYLAGRLDDLARAYSMKGDRREAIATVRRSIEMDPGVPEHQALLDLLEGGGSE